MASQYDEYRPQIEEWRAQGVQPIDMFRQLAQANTGKDFKQSSFYDYLKKLGVKDAGADQALQRFLSEISDSLNQVHSTMGMVLQAVRESDEEAAKRHEQLIQQQLTQRPAPVSQAYAPPTRLYGPGSVPLQQTAWNLPKPRIPKSLLDTAVGFLFLLFVALFLVVITSVDWSVFLDSIFQPKSRI